MKRFAAFVLAALALPALATTVVVPNDRATIERAHAVVVGEALQSHAQKTDNGRIETLTTFSVEEVLKGTVVRRTLEVHEPGGALGGVAYNVPGTPRFVDGERVLLFLYESDGRWAVNDMALGRFGFATNHGGQRLLVRNDDDIGGWNADGSPHVEGQRLAEGFLRFIRDTVAGREASDDYFVPRDRELRVRPETVRVTPNAFDPVTYTMAFFAEGETGKRWSDMPAQHVWYASNTLAGAANGGNDAITAAVNAWSNDCGSNVNYFFAGQNGAAAGGLDANDGTNGIRWEANLGISPFVCGSGGVVARGGFFSVGTHSFTGANWDTIIEGDIDVNQGLANCTSFLGSGEFTTAITHEMGHTLGFRHSYENRTGDACSAAYDCSSFAVMNATIVNGLNGALQTWDQNAVHAVYPGNVCAPCTAPVITAQPQVVTGNPGTLSVTATGTGLSYQWYVGTAGTTTNPISGATGTSIVVSPAFSTAYWVQVTNSCGSVNSSTGWVQVHLVTPASVQALAVSTPPSTYQINVTWAAVPGATSYRVQRLAGGVWGPAVIVGSASYSETQLPPNAAYAYQVQAIDNSPGSNPSSWSTADFATTMTFDDEPINVNSTRIRVGHIIQLRVAVDAMRNAAGLAPFSYTDPVLQAHDATHAGTAIRAVHITQLRTALTQVLNVVVIPVPTFTDANLEAHDATHAGTRIRKLHVSELRTAVK